MEDSILLAEGRRWNVSFVSKLLNLSEVAIRHYPERYNIGTKIGRDWYFSKKDITEIYQRMQSIKKDKIQFDLIENLQN